MKIPVDDRAPGVGERLTACTLPGLICGIALQRLGALLDVPDGSYDLEIPVAATLCALAVAAALWVLLTEAGRRTVVATCALLVGIATGALFAWHALGASGGAL